MVLDIKVARAWQIPFSLTSAGSEVLSGKKLSALPHGGLRTENEVVPNKGAL